ncbi:MmgE/PrpD family protein [Paramicrobacterium fandaimingii]|uniref:MmgE/PrpD family protein n=1 Tax=Paramicrobacterium fandaimingii TaxID=2708079 RepID=UPI001420E06D|nr:MmgE/PrpD family protein [Microbacterium fandaimingii]
MDGLSRALVDVTARLRIDDLPEAAIRAAEQSLLDAIGVSFAAAGKDAGSAAFAQIALAEGGRADATVFGSQQRVPAAAAAFANGAMAHALDYEDSIDGLPVHPHAQTVPAVLALAERENVSGDRLITAIAIGCDVTARMAAAAGDEMGRRGWYPPPILGALGAAVASAHLVGLDSAQTLDALSLVISQATASGEVKFSPHSDVRGVRDAFAAQAAVRSTDLAALGITGFERPLEGRYGFFSTYAGGAYDPAPILDGLGTRFWGTQVSYKPWPSCRGTHSFVEGALRLRGGIRIDAIERVELWGAPVNAMLAEPLESKRRPTRAINAKFSLPFTVASALVHGELSLASFTEPAMRDERVLTLADRIDFVADPSKDNPESMTHGEIVIVLTDGRRLHEDVPTPLGNPASPLGTERLRNKFVDCAAQAPQGMSRGDAERMANRILTLRSSTGLRIDLGEIVSARCGAASRAAYAQA